MSCTIRATSLYNTAHNRGFSPPPDHAHPSIVLLIGVNFERVGPQGVTVWRAPPASSLPRPHAPSRGAGSSLSRQQAALGRYVILRYTGRLVPGARPAGGGATSRVLGLKRVFKKRTGNGRALHIYGTMIVHI